jgi:hypothetical protein
MFKKPEQNAGGSPIPKDEPMIPDPWETPEPEPHFPTPLELDRLLREPHPLMNAAEEFLEIAPAGMPGAELLPAHTGSSEIDPAEVLLKNELKLHDYVVETFNVQLEKALALLYWLATKPEQHLA